MRSPARTPRTETGLRRLVRICLELATRNVVGVLLDVGVPLLGQVVQREDRRNGADRNAGAAVDALDRVDEELVYRIEPRPAIFVLRVLFRMDAIDRTGIHAGRILALMQGSTMYAKILCLAPPLP